MMALKFFFTYFAKLKTVVFFAMHCMYCCKEHVSHAKIFINSFELHKYLAKKIYKYPYTCRLFVG